MARCSPASPKRISAFPRMCFQAVSATVASSHADSTTAGAGCVKTRPVRSSRKRSTQRCVEGRSAHTHPARSLCRSASSSRSSYSLSSHISSGSRSPSDEAIIAAMTRVMLVDDHELVRQGIAAMLTGAGDVQVVAVARTGREALEVARRELPDAVLMAVRMPDMAGLEATRKLKEERPRTAVVMLTMHDNPSYLRDAVRAGAAGYLLKDVSKDELVDAIRQVATGGAFIESQMLKGMLSEMKPQGGAAPSPAAKNLSKREREILAFVAEGMSNREIAEKLVLSPETVKSHVAAILEKLNVSDRTQAAIYAVRNGLVETPSA